MIQLMSHAAVQSHTLLDESLRSLPIPLFESVGHPGPIKLKLPCTDMSLLHPINKHELKLAIDRYLESQTFRSDWAPRPSRQGW